MNVDHSLNKREPIFNNIPTGVMIIVGTLLLIELLIQVFGIEYRSLALIYLAFFPASVNSMGEDLFFGQCYTMFLSYSLIHGSFLHMAINVGVLLALGKKLEEDLGVIKVLVLFFLTATCGALFYLIIFPYEYLPMVGASGSVFGFLGFWKGKELVFRLYKKMKISPVIMFFLALILGNFLMIVFSPFGIAWQAHLGGLVSGLILAFSTRFFRLVKF